MQTSFQKDVRSWVAMHQAAGTVLQAAGTVLVDAAGEGVRIQTRTGRGNEEWYKKNRR